MTAKEFLDQLEAIRTDNPEIFDHLQIEFVDDAYQYISLKLDSIEINKLFNELIINCTEY